MADSITFCEAIFKFVIIISLLMVFLLSITFFISLLANAEYTSHEHEMEKEKNKMEKNKIKEAKKNRKNLVKRIKNMTPEQFDAYYETLVEIYGRECFHKEFAKRYVRNLWGKARCEETVELAKKKSNR